VGASGANLVPTEGFSHATQRGEYDEEGGHRCDRVDGNVNLALVKQALGHRSISSTMVYVGTTDAQAAEAAATAIMAMF
jgi:integrase